MGTKEYKTETVAQRTSKEVLKRILMINAASKATAKKIAQHYTKKDFAYHYGGTATRIETIVK